MNVIDCVETVCRTMKDVVNVIEHLVFQSALWPPWWQIVPWLGGATVVACWLRMRR